MLQEERSPGPPQKIPRISSGNYRIMISIHIKQNLMKFVVKFTLVCVCLHG